MTAARLVCKDELPLPSGKRRARRSRPTLCVRKKG